MESYMISYDIKEGNDYSKLYETIKSYPNQRWCLKSVWIIKSTKSAEQIRDKLSLAINEDDKLLVSRITNPVAGYNIDEKCSAWLDEHL